MWVPIHVTPFPGLTTLFLRYFIKDGTVCEFGSHNELLRKKGDYYEYVQLQGLSRRE
jgi:hypothetical protein